MSLKIKNTIAAVELQAALKKEDLNLINQKLANFQTFDALVVMLDLAKKSFNDYLFLSSLTAFKGTTTRLDFLLRVATSGIIPAGTYSGIGKEDYNAARLFVISMRDDEKDLTEKYWGASRQSASRFKFYPEYSEGSLTDRICAIAKDHVGKGPGMDEQAELFSIGGMFGKSTAMGITKPQGGATTCILVARAIWHAAGINVIQGDTTFNVPKGLFATLPKSLFGYTEFTGGDVSGLTAKAGDIFHIKGDNFDNGNDSTHVGLIVAAMGDTWLTVEGGSGNHITKSNVRKLVKVSTGNWAGRLSFANDIGITSAGARPIVGWYSAGKIVPSCLMQGGESKQ